MVGNDDSLDYVKDDNFPLEYIIKGRGEPVLFIHGNVLADANYPLLHQASLAEKYLLISYRRKGYGKSDNINIPTSISGQARDCAELLRYLDLQNAHIVGHSYGGLIGLQLALQSDNLVRSLTLLEPTIMHNIKSKDTLMIEIGKLVQMYARGDKNQAVDRFLSLVAGPDYKQILDNMLPAESSNNLIHDCDTYFKYELQSIIDWKFTRQMAESINKPILSVVGSNTLPIFKEMHEEILLMLPQSKAMVLPRASHFVQLTNPKQLAEYMAQYFRTAI
jgi:pimeloyl-ACP methyl ester carboxylesterase